MIRIPTHRPPTHPGEMLLEEFLTPMDITQRELAGAIRVHPNGRFVYVANRDKTRDLHVKERELVAYQMLYSAGCGAMAICSFGFG